MAASLVIALLYSLCIHTIQLNISTKWQPKAGFMTHVTCRLTAKNQDQLRNRSLGNRVWATFTFFSHEWEQEGSGDCGRVAIEESGVSKSCRRGAKRGGGLTSCIACAHR